MWCKNYLKVPPKNSNKGNLSKIRVRPELGYLTLAAKYPVLRRLLSCSFLIPLPLTIFGIL